MTKNKKTLILLAVLLVALIAAAAIVIAITAPEVFAGPKQITVEIVYKDGTSESYDLKTKEEFLANAMVEAGLIAEYSEDGYYNTVNGVDALWEVDEGWWCITKSGGYLNFGFNDIAIADGDHYEVTYTCGM